MNETLLGQCSAGVLLDSKKRFFTSQDEQELAGQAIAVRSQLGLSTPKQNGCVCAGIVLGEME
jgi:hypothetical protein